MGSLRRVETDSIEIAYDVRQSAANWGAGHRAMPCTAQHATSPCDMKCLEWVMLSERLWERL